MNPVELIAARNGIVEEVLVKSVIQPPPHEVERKPVAAMAIVDVSGSMNDPAEHQEVETDSDVGTRPSRPDHHGHDVPRTPLTRPSHFETVTKLEAAKRAAARLLDSLQVGDRFGLVIFGTEPVLVSPLAQITAESRETMRTKIMCVVTLGMTNLEGGLRLGLEQFDTEIADSYICRATILSDGQANRGSEDPEYIGSLAHQAAQRGIVTSAAGIGVSYNATLMMAIANAGGGNYAHLKTASDLTAFMNKELADLGSVTCRKASLILTVSPGARVDQNLGGIEQEHVPHGVKVFLGDMSEARSLFFRIHKGPVDKLEVSARVEWIAMDDVPETFETKLELPVVSKGAWEKLPANEAVIKQAGDVIMANGERLAFSAYDRDPNSAAVGKAMASTRSELQSVMAQSMAPGAALASYSRSLDETDRGFQAKSFSAGAAKERGAASYNLSRGRQDRTK